jgi:hypothetical protein
VFVPASAKLDVANSYCAKMVNKSSDYPSGQSPFYESKISLTFYGGTFTLDIYFTNSTLLGSAGWLQFAIYKVALNADLNEFPSVFNNKGNAIDFVHVNIY